MVVDVMILEGIKRAVNGGASLKDAMMSFYNAGYKKEDVEEAARAYQMFKMAQSTQTGIPKTGFKSQPQPRQMASSLPPINNFSQKNTFQNSPQKIPSPNSPQKIPPKNSQTPQTSNSQDKLSKSQNPSTFQPKPFPQPNSFPQKTQQRQVSKAPQKVSAYGQKKSNSTGKIIIIFLIIVLVFLIGSLITALIFKNQIIDFFNGNL